MMAQITKIEKDKLKVVLVDMDGTLADGMGLLFETYLKFLEKYGYQGTEQEFKQLIGPAIPEVLNTLKTRYELTRTTAELVEEYHQILRDTYINKVPLFPGAIDFIRYIKQTPLKLALVTSADKEFADAFLKNHNIREYFDAVITPEGLSSSKPASEIYERALAVLQVSPEEAIAVEDSPNGILAALGADICTVQMRHRKSAEIFHHDHCFPMTGWHDLLKYFQGE